MDEIFAIPFDDWASPGFISSYGLYYATAAMAEEYVNRLKLAKKMKEYIKAFEKYKNGDTSVKVEVLFSEVTLMMPTEVLARADFCHENVEWDHYNVWQCSYEMRASKISRNVIWLRHDDNYLRAARYEINNFGYVGILQNEIDLFCESETDYWGIPQMLYNIGNRTFSSMYIPERKFNTREECLKDISSPELFMEKDFRTMCGCAFGDG